MIDPWVRFEGGSFGGGRGDTEAGLVEEGCDD